MNDEHLRYLGCLKLLEECSPHVDDEMRESIERAFEDAVAASGGTLRMHRLLDRVCIDVAVPTEKPQP